MDDAKILVKGWQKRGIYSDPKLTEIFTMYEELGFIVRLEGFSPEKEQGCSECFKENAEEMKVLYTKNKVDSD